LLAEIGPISDSPSDSGIRPRTGLACQSGTALMVHDTRKALVSWLAKRQRENESTDVLVHHGVGGFFSTEIHFGFYSNGNS
jgi:hypothetical protein